MWKQKHTGDGQEKHISEQSKNQTFVVVKPKVSHPKFTRHGYLFSFSLTNCAGKLTQFPGQKGDRNKYCALCIVHPYLTLSNNLFHFQIAAQYSPSRSVMSFSRWAMSKISARCSWTCLRISWTKNQRSPCLLKSKNIQHAIVELSSWFHTLRHVFPRCWGCKTARTDGFLSPTIQPTLRKILPRITEVGHGEAEAAQQNLLVSYRQKWP